jgi:NADP-dependent 3-hydroxy acid dehydrogenase YdfG
MLAERGTKVVLGARRPERLEALAGRIAASGGEAAWARADVRRREDLSRLVELACERFGRLDVLVGNAGIGPVSLLDEVRVGDWEDMIDVNIKGVLYSIAAALPVFRKQGFGHFVHIASTAAVMVVPTMAVYSATKIAVRAISEGLRQEAGAKLRVPIVTPGFVSTELVESVTDPQLRDRFAALRDVLRFWPKTVRKSTGTGSSLFGGSRAPGRSRHGYSARLARYYLAARCHADGDVIAGCCV